MEDGASGVQASDGHHEDPILSTVGGMHLERSRQERYCETLKEEAHIT